MDLPKPPEDQELRNIIDKLAQFVARNGPEFEQMTKDKQRDNPRFYFLFGGEFFNYYQFRVTSEQSVIRNNQELQQQQQQHLSAMSSMPSMAGQYLQQQMLTQSQSQSHPNIWQNNSINTMSANNLNSNIPHTQSNLISQQINESQEQIRQSETNLAAQHQVLMQQKQIMVDDLIKQSQEESLRNISDECNISLTEFEAVLQPIIENCTKESIANGKMWIFNHSNSPFHYEVIAKYLLKRITSSGSTFDSKLHLMYLINDLFNHCMRKGDNNLKRVLDTVIVPIFCCTYIDADDEKQQKLTKQLQNPQMALANYKSALCNDFSGQISQITSGQLAKYSQLQKQHNDFVAHIQNKIQQLQQQKQQMVANVAQMPVPTMSLPVNPSGLPLPSVPQMMLPNAGPMPRPPMQYDQQPPVFLPLVHQQQQASNNANQTSPALLMPQMIPQNPQMPVRLGSVPPLPQSMVPVSQPYTGPPVSTHFPSPLSTPQFFNAVHNSTPITPKEVIPDVPYYELPAGLMAPLVKLEDFEYKSIIPKDIRLPPPAPPNDRLLQAVEMFYAPPTHERPRNSDGWEQLGLYEFFKAKSQAKKINDSSPIISNEIETELFPAVQQNINLNNNIVSQQIEIPVSIETNTKQNQIQNTEQSQPNSPTNHSRHRSPSPYSSKRRYKEDKSPRKNKRISRSRSPVSTRRHRSHSRSRSRSRSKTPERSSRSYRSRSRSLTPPPNSFSSYGKQETSRIDESNKGHQMLKKMGWSGISGLGVSEQGMQDPIRGGEVRDKHDQYKGVGIEMNDPYEKFRKNKGQAFMQRITQGRSGEK